MTLVLTRKPGQQIRVGDDVLITFIEHRPDGAIRIGIDAPRHIAVERINPSPTTKENNA